MSICALDVELLGLVLVCRGLVLLLLLRHIELIAEHERKGHVNKEPGRCL